MNSPSQRWDRETASVAALAACVSVVAFLITYRNGAVLLYGDAVAHINIARRVFDSQTPGLLQLGTVWLPLPHLLMMPLVASNWAWQTGVGGSLPSMAAYVFGVVGLFRLVRGAVSHSTRLQPQASAVAVFAATIYALNPNLLYLQSTAMTEPFYLALFIWTVVHFAEFAEERRTNGWKEKARRSLWKCGAVLTAACLTRYDGWFLSAAVVALVLSMAWRSDGARVLRSIAVFVVLAGAAPLLWFAYNAAVYGNALEFANGPYSARAIEKRTAVPGSPPHPGTHNLRTAGLYFLKSAEFSVAEGNWQRVWILLALLGAGFVAFVDRRLAALLLVLIPIPFYMLSVAYGGVPIFTPTWCPFSYYNIRYGTQLLPALAVFVTLAAFYCVSFIKQPAGKLLAVVAAVALVIASYATVWRAQPVCFREAWINSRTRLQLESSLAEQLQRLPPNSTLLMYLGEHVGALQDAGIPLKRTINEGNHRVWRQPSDPEGLWERALKDPSKFADYVVAFDGDPVWLAVAGHGLQAVAIIAVNGQRKATIFQTPRIFSQPSPVTTRVNGGPWTAVGLPIFR
jgi:hypothetical protein